MVNYKLYLILTSTERRDTKIPEAIYFTKENNEKKILGTSKASDLTYLVQISDQEKKIFQQMLGHPLKNLFINIGGKEYRLIDTK